MVKRTIFLLLNSIKMLVTMILYGCYRYHSAIRDIGTKNNYNFSWKNRLSKLAESRRIEFVFFETKCS